MTAAREAGLTDKEIRAAMRKALRVRKVVQDKANDYTDWVEEMAKGGELTLSHRSGCNE